MNEYHRSICPDCGAEWGWEWIIPDTKCAGHCDPCPECRPTAYMHPLREWKYADEFAAWVAQTRAEVK